MGYRPGDAYYREFTLTSPGGALVNADSLPTATANHNGANDATFVLSITNMATGVYKVTGTIPVGYTGGDVVNVVLSATIGGVNTGSVIDAFVLDRTGPFLVNSANAFTFAMVQSSDHISPYTGGNVTGVRSIGGVTEGNVTGSVTQVGTTNRYYFAGAAADFNGTSIEFTFSATGADPVTVSVNTHP